MEDKLFISQGLAPTTQRLKFELSYLYEWVQLLIQDERENCVNLWKYLVITLERIYVASFETKPSISNETNYCCISLINSLIGKPKWLIENTLCSTFLILCVNLSYLLLFREKKLKESRQIISLVGDACLCKNDQLSCLYKLSPNGVYYFTTQAKILGAIGNYELALNKLSLIESLSDVSEEMKVTHLKSKLQLDSGKFEEASTLLIRKTQNQVIDKKLKSSIFNTIGCCLAKKGKPNMASLWFHKAYIEDNDNCLSLWNLSLQYRDQGNSEAEISVLDLLIQTSKNVKSYHDESDGQSVITYLEALYLFAYRNLQLKFYNNAMDSYKQLERMLENTDYLPKKWKIISRPSLIKIKIEMAYTYYHMNFLSEAMEICDFINFHDFPETKEENKPGLLRNFIQGNSSYFDKPKHGFYGISASLIKALALIKLGLDNDAKDILKKIISSMSLFNIDKKDTITVSKDSEPQLKKMKLDTLESENKRMSDVFQLVSLTYGNLAILRIKKGHNQDALHMLEVSLLSWPSNIDALFNYVLLLIKLNQTDKAAKVWLDAKLNNLTLQKALDFIEGQKGHCFTVPIHDLKILNTFFN